MQLIEFETQQIAAALAGMAENGELGDISPEYTQKDFAMAIVTHVNRTIEDIVVRLRMGDMAEVAKLKLSRHCDMHNCYSPVATDNIFCATHWAQEQAMFKEAQRAQKLAEETEIFF